MAGKRHTSQDISAKLQQADDMSAKGKTQREISRALGVSIMTLHRWRKAGGEPTLAPSPPVELGSADRAADVPGGGRLAELQRENAKLRRLVTDLLLEKLTLEEELEGRTDHRRKQPYR